MLKIVKDHLKNDKYYVFTIQVETEGNTLLTLANLQRSIW